MKKLDLIDIGKLFGSHFFIHWRLYLHVLLRERLELVVWKHVKWHTPIRASKFQFGEMLLQMNPKKKKEINTQQKTIENNRKPAFEHQVLFEEGVFLRNRVLLHVKRYKSIWNLYKIFAQLMQWGTKFYFSYNFFYVWVTHVLCIET